MKSFLIIMGLINIIGVTKAFEVITVYHRAQFEISLNGQIKYYQANIQGFDKRYFCVHINDDEANTVHVYVSRSLPANPEGRKNFELLSEDVEFNEVCIPRDYLSGTSTFFLGLAPKFSHQHGYLLDFQAFEVINLSSLESIAYTACQGLTTQYLYISKIDNLFSNFYAITEEHTEIDVQITFKNSKDSKQTKITMQSGYIPHGKVFLSDTTIQEAEGSYSIQINAPRDAFVLFGSRDIGRYKKTYLEPDQYPVYGFWNKTLSSSISKICYYLNCFLRSWYNIDITSFFGEVSGQIIGTVDDEEKVVEEWKIERSSKHSFVYEEDMTLCVIFNTDIVSYSVQLTSLKDQNQRTRPFDFPLYVDYKYIFYSVNGYTERYRNLKSTEKLGYLVVSENTETRLEIFSQTCSNWPKCDFWNDNGKLEDDGDSLIDYYRIHNGELDQKNKRSLLSSFDQYYLSVKCIDKSKNNRGCKYSVQFFPNSEVKIGMIQKRVYYKELTYEKEVFTFTVSDDTVEKIKIDVNMFSEDLVAELTRGEGILTTTVVANLMMIEVTKGENPLKGDYDITIKGIVGATFSLKYDLIKTGENSIDYRLEKGISSLVKLLPKEKKKVFSFNQLDGEFLTRATPLNCSVTVSYIKSESETEPVQYDGNSYIHLVKTVEENQTVYYEITNKEEKVCYLYMLSSPNTNLPLVINNVIMSRFLLSKKYPSLNLMIPKRTATLIGSWLHFYAEKEKSIPSKFIIGSTGSTSGLVYQHQEISINHSEMILRFYLPEHSTNAPFSFAIKNSVIPTLIHKNQLYNSRFAKNEKADYYYYEIGESEEGEIHFNFLLGEENIRVYARIVDKNAKEENPNWRGVQYPKEGGPDVLTLDNLPTKKISYTSKDTSKCTNTCYIIILIQNINESQVSSFIYAEYSFFVKTLERKVQIFYDEIVADSLTGSISSGKYNYYYLYTEEEKNLEIDITCDLCKVFINNQIEKYPSQEESVWSFTAKTKNNYFTFRPESEVISISVGVTAIDMAKVGYYKLKIKRAENLVNEAKKNTQNLCKVTKTNGRHICYYKFNPDNYFKYEHLYFFAYSPYGGKNYIDVNIVDKKTYIESSDENRLKMFPYDSYTNFTNKGEINFTNYLEANLKGEEENKGMKEEKETLILINVYSENTLLDTTLINLLINGNSFNSNNGITLNSYYPQMFVIDENTTSRLTPRLFTTSHLHIVPISGELDVVSRNEIFTISPSKYHSFIVGDKDASQKDVLLNNTSKDKKLAFYCYLEQSENNGENVEYGLTKIFNFTSFTMTFYSLVETTNYNLYVNIFFNIRENFGANNDIKIKGFVVTGEEIANYRSNYGYIPKYEKEIKGVYNPLFHIATIHFETDDFTNLNQSDKGESQKYLFLSLNQSESFRKYLNGTILITPSNSIDRLTQNNLYITGHFAKNQKLPNIYHLRAPTWEQKYIRLHITLSKDMNFIYVDNLEDADSLKNSTKNTILYEYNNHGVNVIDFDLNGVRLDMFLLIFSTSENLETRHSKFAFKYEVSDKLLDRALVMGKGNFNYKVPRTMDSSPQKVIFDFTPVMLYHGRYFTVGPCDYFIRVYKESRLVAENETIDSIIPADTEFSSSMKVSGGEENRTMYLELVVERNSLVAISVFARSKLEEEFFTYPHLMVNTSYFVPKKEDIEISPKFLLFVMIGLFSVSLVLFVIIVIIYACKKNQKDFTPEEILNGINSSRSSFISLEEQN